MAAGSGGRRSGCSGKNYRCRDFYHGQRGALLWVISVLDDSRQRQQGAHRDEERFIVCAHEKLTEFLEPQEAIHELAVNPIV